MTKDELRSWYMALKAVRAAVRRREMEEAMGTTENLDDRRLTPAEVRQQAALHQPGRVDVARLIDGLAWLVICGLSGALVVLALWRLVEATR